jgi:integrase
MFLKVSPVFDCYLFNNQYDGDHIMAKWKKTSFPGVRYREHPTRKHGVRRDQYFTIRYKINSGIKNEKGKDISRDKEEGLGWASENWTAAKAYEHLKELKENRKAGEGPQTLAEKREAETLRKESEESERQRHEKENITFKQYFEATYYPVSLSSKKKNSFSQEEAHFRLWLNPVIGNKPLKEISEFDIIRVCKKLEKAGRSQRTSQYVLATFRQVWHHARKSGFVNIDSPTKEVIKKLNYDNRRQRFLSHADANRLLEALRSENITLYSMALLSLHTGMRASEIFKLTWGCIDIERGLILILDTKSGRNRTAFMTEDVKAMFREMKPKAHDHLVFVWTKGTDKNMPLRSIPKPFRKVVKQLGFNDGISDRRQRFCFHSLRHTMASWHAEAGTNLYVIKELLGHSTITLTERYSHLSNNPLLNATKALENSIKAANEKAGSGQVVNLK